MSGSGHSEDFFELPGDPIMESSSINPPTTGKSGISLNGMFTRIFPSFSCWGILLMLDFDVRFTDMAYEEQMLAALISTGTLRSYEGSRSSILAHS